MVSASEALSRGNRRDKLTPRFEDLGNLKGLGEGDDGPSEAV